MFFNPSQRIFFSSTNSNTQQPKYSLTHFIFECVLLPIFYHRIQSLLLTLIRWQRKRNSMKLMLVRYRTYWFCFVMNENKNHLNFYTFICSHFKLFWIRWTQLSVGVFGIQALTLISVHTMSSQFDLGGCFQFFILIIVLLCSPNAALMRP